MKSVVIAAGGSGGHIVPALAVAREFHRRKVLRVFWLGGRRMQDSILEAEDFPVHTILLRPLRGGGLWRKSVYFLSLPVAFVQALVIFLRVRASAVFSTGGYAVFPAALVAGLLGLPLFLQEQNSRWSLASRLLLPFARRVYTAYPNMQTKEKLLPKIRCTGNPLLASGSDKPELPPAERYSRRRGPLRLLVTGGSQGARALNELVPQALASVSKNGTAWEVRHQCGKGWRRQTLANYEKLEMKTEVREFISDIKQDYLWADLVVSRSGAMTLLDIMSAGVASFLVPFPYATDDHQWHNARYFADRQAALLARQDEAADQLCTFFEGLNPLSSASLTRSSAAKPDYEKSRKHLSEIAQRIYALRRPNATQDITDSITEELQCA